MSPAGFIHSHRRGRAHGLWIRHVRRHDALVDRLPFMVPDTWLRPVGCFGLAFRELISPTLAARASWTGVGLVKSDRI